MSKIKQIIQGYKNLIIEDKELEPLFQSRYETCLTCENNKLGVCKLCLCPVIAKSHSPLEDCPAHYWKPVFYIDNGFQYVLRSELPKNLRKYFPKEEIELSDWLEFLKINHKDKEEIYE